MKLEFKSKLPEIGRGRGKRARKGKWGSFQERVWNVLDTKDPSHRSPEPTVPKT